MTIKKLTPLEHIKNMLHEGMIEGQMHVCLRDTGRLAGGYLTSGSLSLSDIECLEHIALDLCKNKTEGLDKWRSAIEFGKREPVLWNEKSESRALDWNEIVLNPYEPGNDLRVIDPGWIEDAEITEPGEDWDQAGELITYLSALFEAADYVGYVTESWQKDERYLPKKGNYTQTAGELIAGLAKCGGDLGKVIGDYDPAAGAWIRFNPLDGTGVRDDNVTAFRYALIESDTLSIERQAAIYEELELPIAALVHSGKKSLHAIVRVNATSKEEYRDRVNFLHEVCEKNSLQVDGANKNPSRLSRMPGIWRNGQKQYLVGVNKGKASWEEWKAHIEAVNDNLPDFESLADVFGNLPPLAPPLIDGVLRCGHKLLLSGPSKAGKSFILLQLAMAIAEGRDWLGWPCKKGRVLYVNLELDTASCLHRLKALYEAHDWEPRNVANIDLWNLRGKAVPLDLLAPKLIRRAMKRQYTAVIIDPIYKVLTGSENEADDMARFCNQFDLICHQLGAATIYCHHHSKGSQGQKNSRDRSSGSGVFARDPDAIIDLLELVIEKSRRQQIEERYTCAALTRVLDVHSDMWSESISQDDMLIPARLIEHAAKFAPQEEIAAAMWSAQQAAKNVSGWRMEGTLREFAPFDARRFFFRYPIHLADVDGMLADAKADGEEAPWQADRREKQKQNREQKMGEREALETAYNILAGWDGEDEVRIGDLADHMGLTEKTLRDRVKKTSQYVIEKNVILPKAEAARRELLGSWEAAKDLQGLVKLADWAERRNINISTLRSRVENCKDFEIVNGYVRRVET